MTTYASKMYWAWLLRPLVTKLKFKQSSKSSSHRMQKDGMRWGFHGEATILPYPATKSEVFDGWGTL